VQAGAARKPGRPPSSEEAVERRRREIVEAAYVVFSERGYHAAGIADIAARLGIGHGTFYRYFENKRDILDHVVDYGVERFLDAAFFDISLDVDDLGSFRERVLEILTRMFDELEDDPALTRVVLLEATSIDEELTQRIMGLLESYNTLSVPLLRSGVDKGFLRADLDVDSVARAITGMTLAGLFAVMRGAFGKPERTRYIEAAAAP
jgi:AcrR family transcriptional regulator